MTDNRRILAALTTIIEQATAGDVRGEVTEEKSFHDDLDIDSLAMVEIAVRVEEELGVQIPDNHLSSLRTVGEAVRYIARCSPLAS